MAVVRPYHILTERFNALVESKFTYSIAYGTGGSWFIRSQDPFGLTLRTSFNRSMAWRMATACPLSTGCVSARELSRTNWVTRTTLIGGSVGYGTF
jgi:hypothetical protein